MPTKAEIFAELARRGVKPPPNFEAMQTYNQAFARGRAKKDVDTIERATEGVRTGDNLLATAGEARSILDEGVPTGTFGDTRMALGKAIGNPVTNVLSLGFVPKKQTASKMERFQQLTNEAVLGDVSKLKGPLSDRDIQFLKDTQAGLNTTPEGNRQALAARDWAATRMKAYESALQSWTSKLGAPSALNPNGQSFDAWFSDWATQNVPPPSGGKFTYRGPSSGLKPAAMGKPKGAAGLSDDELKAQLGL